VPLRQVWRRRRHRRCDRCKGYGEIPCPTDPYALLMVPCPDPPQLPLCPYRRWPIERRCTVREPHYHAGNPTRFRGE
jgi:hypothetical protein